MTKLRIFLIAVYVILIALLLLLRGCGEERRGDIMVMPEPVGPVSDSSITDSSAVGEEVPVTEELREEASSVGASGDLKVTLLWDFEGDIDVHVLQPNGTEINYTRKSDNSTGGSLDVDNKEGGTGSAENIYWNHPAKGTYRVMLNYYQPSEKTKVIGSGPCRVVIIRKGENAKSYKVMMSAVGETKQVATFNIE